MAFCQQTLSFAAPQRLMIDAQGQLEAQRYSLAQQLFDEYLSFSSNLPHRPEAHLGGIVASVNLFRADAEQRFLKFQTEYPDHLLLQYAKSELGAQQFQQKKYEEAITWLEGLDVNAFEHEKREKIRFQLGYAYFSRKDFEKSAPLLAMVKVSNSPFKSAAAYYSAYIQYKAEKYDAALNDLKTIEKDPAYAKVVPLMRMQIYYQQKLYKELLEQPLELELSQLNDEQLIILGDANYFLNRPEIAETFYSQLLNRKTAQKSPELLYRIGDTYSKLQQTENSIRVFKLIPVSSDSLYAIAAYQIGRGYLILGDENLALAPLIVSSSKSVNPEVQLKACMDLLSIYMNKMDYQEVIKTGKRVLGTKNIRQEERTLVSEWISEAYLRTQNLDEAIKHLKENGINSSFSRRTYQEATLQKGIEEYHQDHTDTAIFYFVESLKYQVNPELTAVAYLSQAECYSRKTDLVSAKKAYLSIQDIPDGKRLSAYSFSLYGLGFIAYKSGDYNQAETYFEEYINEAISGKISEPIADAQLRLADCYYINKRYDKALAAYRASLPRNSSETDYVLFQTACIHFLKSEYPQATSLFEQIKQKYPNSVYHDDAIYQLGQLELENSRYEQAIAQYNMLIKRHSGSLLVPYSLYKRALSYQNLKQFELALADYKAVLDRYPEHTQAKSALLGMQETYTMAGTPENFQDVLETYKIKSPGDGTLEGLEYETAKNTYLAERYAKAVESIKKFVQSYPQSVHRLELMYYLAESHYQISQYQEALLIYEQLIISGRNPYLNKSLGRAADLTFSDRNYVVSANYYKMLLEVAEAAKEKSSAYTGLSQCFFELSQYDSCLKALDQLFKLKQQSQSQELSAKLLAAKAALALGDETKSTDYLLEVINRSQDARSAEAAYLLAELDYKKGSFEKALEALYKFPGRYSQHEFWLGKAFLLISDCFISIDDQPQAIATLQSIIENSEEQTIVQEAKEKLQKITEVKESGGAND